MLAHCVLSMVDALTRRGADAHTAGLERITVVPPPSTRPVLARRWGGSLYAFLTLSAARAVLSFTFSAARAAASLPLSTARTVLSFTFSAASFTVSAASLIPFLILSVVLPMTVLLLMLVLPGFSILPVLCLCSDLNQPERIGKVSTREKCTMVYCPFRMRTMEQKRCHLSPTRGKNQALLSHTDGT